MAIKVGSQAPDFTLKSKTEQGMVSITLSDNFGVRGSLLFFVPAAFTGVCTKQFCGLYGELPDIETADLALYGITVDMPYSLAAWAREHDIRIPLLSDFAKTVTVAYDLEEPDFAGLGASVSKRAIVLIDKQGVVRYVQVTASTGDMPNFGELRSALGTIGL